MHARLVLTAAAALMSGSASAAVAPNAAAQPQVQPQSPPVRVVLASAGDVRVPSASDQDSAAQPKRPHAARVTDCRCGGQMIDPDDVSDDSPDQ